MLADCTGIAHWAQVHAQQTRQKTEKTLGMLNNLEYLISYLRNVTAVQRAYMISGDANAIVGIPAMRKDADVVATREPTSVRWKNVASQTA